MGEGERAHVLTLGRCGPQSTQAYLRRRRAPQVVPPGYRGAVTRSVRLAVGVVLIIFGAVFFLQGINVLGGSGMSGKTLWAILGPVIALVGVGLVVGGRRRA